MRRRGGRGGAERRRVRGGQEGQDMEKVGSGWTHRVSESYPAGDARRYLGVTSCGWTYGPSGAMPAGTLGGAYRPTGPAGRCPLGLQIKLGVWPNRRMGGRDHGVGCGTSRDDRLAGDE
eukprot:3598063-Rhodomonas_salina.1